MMRLSRARQISGFSLLQIKFVLHKVAGNKEVHCAVCCLQQDNSAHYHMRHSVGKIGASEKAIRQYTRRDKQEGTYNWLAI